MSYSSHGLPGHLRKPSASTGGGAAAQSPLLLARINEKKEELEHLKQLRDLSAGLAGQMQILEQKLSTLSDGTEAVATVLSNWHNVLRAINMAASAIPKPKDADKARDLLCDAVAANDVPLPQTLVRIPTDQAPMLQQAAEESES